MKRFAIAMACTLACLALALPATAREKGDWMARLRVINVNPNDDSSMVTGIADSSVSVDDDTVPELDFTYMLSDNWGLELILAQSQHRASGEGSLVDLGEILEADVLPPTLTLQYHFDSNGKVLPYAGIGVNYTIFSGEESRPSLDTALGGPTTIEMDESFGFAAQAGLDVPFNERWFFNVDAKYVQIDSTVELNTEGTLRTVEVDIDPLILGVGVGLKF